MSNPIYEARLLHKHLGFEQTYIVTPTADFISDAQHRFLGIFAEDTLAFTTPVADLMFKNTVLKYEWTGRDFCMVCCRSPLTFSRHRFFGLSLHERGHWLDLFDHPSRDDTNYERAQQAWYGDKVKRECHTHRWLRATVHLWHRACRLGYEIPFANVVNLEQYGYNRKDLLPLLNEASQRESEPIESILGSRATVSARSAVPVSDSRPRSTRERLKAMGIAFSGWSGWLDGEQGEFSYRGGELVATIGGREVSDEEMAAFYARWKTGGLNTRSTYAVA